MSNIVKYRARIHKCPRHQRRPHTYTHTHTHPRTHLKRAAYPACTAAIPTGDARHCAQKATQ